MSTARPSDLSRGVPFALVSPVGNRNSTRFEWMGLRQFSIVFEKGGLDSWVEGSVSCAGFPFSDSSTRTAVTGRSTEASFWKSVATRVRRLISLFCLSGMLVVRMRFGCSLGCEKTVSLFATFSSAHATTLGGESRCFLKSIFSSSRAALASLEFKTLRRSSETSLRISTLGTSCIAFC